jgi:putative transposase
VFVDEDRWNRINELTMEPIEYGNTYHLFNQGNNRENIFVESDNYRFFMSLFKKYMAEICEVYAYVLMINHFHFLIRIKDVKEIDNPEITCKPAWRYLSNFLNAYAKSFNKKYNRTGSLFRYKSRRKNVHDENYLINLVKYIHFNPQNHGLIEDFKNWPHSSWKAYVTNKPSLIARDYTIEEFGGMDNFLFMHRIVEDLDGEY